MTLSTHRGPTHFDPKGSDARIIRWLYLYCPILPLRSKYVPRGGPKQIRSVNISNAKIPAKS